MIKVRRNVVEITENGLRTLVRAGKVERAEFVQIPSGAFDNRPAFIVVVRVRDAEEVRVLVATRGGSGVRVLKIHPGVSGFIKKFEDLDFEPVKIRAESKLTAPGILGDLGLSVVAGSSE